MQEIGLVIPSADFFTDELVKVTIKPEIKDKKTEYKVIYGTPEEVSMQTTRTLESEGWRIWGPPLPYGSYLAQTVIKEEKIYSWGGVDYPYSGEFKNLYSRIEGLSEDEISWELERHLKPLRIAKGLATAVVKYDEESIPN